MHTFTWSYMKDISTCIEEYRHGFFIDDLTFTGWTRDFYRPINLRTTTNSSQLAYVKFTWERGFSTDPNEDWEIQISTDRNFNSDSIKLRDVKHIVQGQPLEYEYVGLVPNVTYYARIKPQGATDAHFWSDIATFTSSNRRNVTLFNGSNQHNRIPLDILRTNLKVCTQRSEFIIPSSALSTLDIVDGDIINSLKFHTYGYTTTYIRNFRVYFKEVGYTSFPENYNDFQTADTTVVFNGRLSSSIDGLKIELKGNGYSYHGGNLLVGIYVTPNETDEGSLTTLPFIGTYAENASFYRFYKPGGTISPGTYEGPMRQNFLPQVTIGITPRPSTRLLNIHSIAYDSQVDAYVITNVNNLNDLSVYVRGSGNYSSNGGSESTAHDCAGLTFKVTNDIDFDHNTSWNESTSTESNFSAIGIFGAPFRGIFDGQGHTISGLRIYKGGDNTEDKYQGLFGCVAGLVQNVAIADARITGHKYVGGIAGNNWGSIFNCKVGSNVAIHAVVNDATQHGGIAGTHSIDTIKNCVSSAQFTVASNIANISYAEWGGIVGSRGNGTVKNNIADSVTIPSVTSSNDLGGIYLGAIFGNKILSPNVEGFYSRDNYYVNCSVDNKTTNIGAARDNNIGDISYTDIFDQNVDVAVHIGTITLTEPNYINISTEPTVVYNETNYYAKGHTITLIPMNIPGYNHAFTVTDAESTPVAVTNDQFIMPSSNVTVNIAYTLIDWETTFAGTEDDPYIIYNAAQLDILAERVNNGNQYSGKYFKLGDDIYYRSEEAWNDNSSTVNNYTAIGTGTHGNSIDNYFCGIFDGEGHTVNGIRIYSEGDCQGLFGRIGLNSVVKNVTLSDARITGSYRCGGIVGNNYKGTVTGCKAFDDVAIYSNKENIYYHGGIVGMNHGGTVSYCASSATIDVQSGITSNDVYGGIVGGLDNCENVNVFNNLAYGVTIGNNYGEKGAICGSTCGTFHHNYYYNCNIGGNSTNVGLRLGDNPTNDAAVPLPTVAVGAGTWQAVASPMCDYNMASIATGNVDNLKNSIYDLFRYNETSATWENQLGHNGFAFERGRGYIYRAMSATNLAFLGFANTSGVNGPSLTVGSSDDALCGFNLVGNPYPHPIRKDQAFDVSSGVLATGWYSLEPDGRWIARLDSDPIATGQAVLVKANQAVEQLQFNETVPASKASSSMHSTLAFRVKGGNYCDIVYADIEGIGTGLNKIAHLNADAPTLSIPVDGNDYAIAMLPKETTEFAMNFSGRGEYTLEFMGNVGFMGVGYCHLTDRVTGADIDLLSSPTYTFTGTGNDANRFIVKLSQDVFQFAYHSGNNIIINGTGTLQVFDIIGKKLFSHEVNSQLSIPKSQFTGTGVYILRLGEKTQKIVIR